MFRRTFLALLLVFSLQPHAKEHPQVLLETNYGNIVIELFPEKTPETVKNFLTYVNEGFYDGTIFHRVIKDFMIQGGGYTPDLQRKLTRAPIKNETDNGLHNKIGYVAMARTSDPHSATSQFFINVANNSFLDFREKTPRGYGYAVFGRVIKGMQVVNKIRQVQTGWVKGMKDVPVKPVIIKKARQIK